MADLSPGSVRSGWTTSEGGAGKAAKKLGMTMEQYTEVTAKAHTTGRIVEPDWQQHREGLPDLGVEAGALDFGDDDVVGFL